MSVHQETTAVMDSFNTGICPGCGRCEHCGRPRDNRPLYPVPIQPIPYPVYPVTPWWQTPWICVGNDDAPVMHTTGLAQTIGSEVGAV